VNAVRQRLLDSLARLSSHILWIEAKRVEDEEAILVMESRASVLKAARDL